MFPASLSSGADSRMSFYNASAEAQCGRYVPLIKHLHIQKNIISFEPYPFYRKYSVSDRGRNNYSVL